MPSWRLVSALCAGVVLCLALITVAAAAGGPDLGQNKPIGTEAGSNWLAAEVFFTDQDPSDCLTSNVLVGATDTPSGDSSAYRAVSLGDSCTGTSWQSGFVQQPIAADSFVVDSSLKSAHLVFTSAADDGSPVTLDVTWTANGDPVHGRPSVDVGLKAKWALIRGASASGTLTVNSKTYTLTSGGIIWRGQLPP